MRPNLKLLLLMAMLLLPMFIDTLVAQPPPPPPQEIPIDGGLGMLLAAGLAYGAKKLRDNKKEA